jgi:hypothetical protein
LLNLLVEKLLNALFDWFCGCIWRLGVEHGRVAGTFVHFLDVLSLVHRVLISSHSDLRVLEAGHLLGVAHVGANGVLPASAESRRLWAVLVEIRCWLPLLSRGDAPDSHSVHVLVHFNDHNIVWRGVALVPPVQPLPCLGIAPKLGWRAYLLASLVVPHDWRCFSMTVAPDLWAHVESYK